MIVAVIVVGIVGSLIIVVVIVIVVVEVHEGLLHNCHLVCENYEAYTLDVIVVIVVYVVLTDVSSFVAIGVIVIVASIVVD